jgi:hypothetical protein
MPTENQDAPQTETHKEISAHNHSHHSVKIILMVVLMVVLLGVVFAAGRVSTRNKFYGFNRTNNINVSRASFGGAMAGRSMGRGNFRGSDISGQISNINGNTLTVKDADGTDYIVNIANNTSIIINRKIDKTADLKTSAQVAVNGPSNSDGSINATIIRATQ